MDDKIVELVRGRQYFENPDLVLPELHVSKGVVEKTKKALASFSVPEPKEGVVYWVGKRGKGKLTVNEVIVPKAVLTPTSFRVSSFENARIIGELQKKGLELIAQVSTRPAGSDLSISLADNEMGFLPFEGLFFIFVADYGLEGMLPWEERTGIYLYRHHQFFRLTCKQLKELIKSDE